MKYLTGILFMLLLLTNHTSAYAGEAAEDKEKFCTVETLGSFQEDCDEIVGLDDEIRQIISEIGKKLNGDIISEDIKIDYGTAYKIYVDSDIFAADSADGKSIMETLEEGIYMYLLILNVGDTTYQVNISKGLPLDESVREFLTEKQIEKIEAEEGKWSIAGIEILEDGDESYEKKIENALANVKRPENAKIILCGGLKHINQPVALVMDGEKAQFLIPLYDLEIRGTEEQLAEIKPEKAEKNDNVYLYEKIKTAVNNMKDSDTDSVGATGYIDLNSGIKTADNTKQDNKNKNILPAAVAVLITAAAVCICLTVYKRRRR